MFIPQISSEAATEKCAAIVRRYDPEHDFNRDFPVTWAEREIVEVLLYLLAAVDPPIED